MERGQIVLPLGSLCSCPILFLRQDPALCHTSPQINSLSKALMGNVCYVTISWGNGRPGYIAYHTVKFNLIPSLNIPLLKSLSYLTLPWSFPSTFFYSSCLLSSSAILPPPRFQFASISFLIQSNLTFLWASTIYILICQPGLLFHLGSSSLEAGDIIDNNQHC